MFRSVLISHDGSRCLESTLEWMTPLLGNGHSEVELFGRLDAECASELNSQAHLAELAEGLTAAGASVTTLPSDYDLLGATQRKLVVVHDASLALSLLQESTASVFFSPEGVSPHVPKRILVPLDGSSYAEEILPLLVALARAFGSHVELLRIEEDGIAGQGSLMARTTDPTRRRLLRSLERAKAFLEDQGVKVTTHASRPGRVSRRILETAAQDQADLVAVSTHGHNRIARWLFGSCAETLIKSGSTPVLVRNTRKGTSDRHALPLEASQTASA
jgi:nucleotide-binding universal stress UspA family protein